MNSLKHNIAAMRETKQTPSFVQVLVTFEEAADRIETLEAALRGLYDWCGKNVDVRYDSQTMRIARVALDQSSPPKAST